MEKLFDATIVNLKETMKRDKDNFTKILQKIQYEN